MMRSVIAGLVAFCVACVAALLLGGGGLTPALAWTALGLGAVAGSAAWWTLRDLPPGAPFRGWGAWAAGIAFTLFALRAFCWLIFLKNGDIAFLSPNNLGDLSLHLTFIRYFANGAPLWPENPIFSSAPLHYPFAVDLFNSLLTLAGADVLRGLVWVGLLGALATGVMLWRWGGAFTMAGFLFNGGLAGLAFFTTWRVLDYQDAVDWKSIPLALFVTQRGLLYAIPAGLALLWSWRERFFRAATGRGALPFWIEALLYATMPFFHLHTFLFLSAMLGAWLLIPAAPRREIVKLGMAAFVPATLLVLKLTGAGQAGGAIHLAPGWIGKDLPLLEAVLQNFGVLPFFCAALLAWLWITRSRPVTRELAAMALPAMAVFALACVVIFATWEWDNTKLMIWSYLVILPALDALLREGGQPVRAIGCAALYFSGALSLAAGLGGRHAGYTLASRVELDTLAPALKPIPIGATFACLPTYNHPLLLLGRKAVSGYEGHLSSHGIDYRARFEALERLLKAEPGWEARARELGADYLYWGPREQEKYTAEGGERDPWRNRLPLVAEGPWGALYDLRGIGKTNQELKNSGIFKQETPALPAPLQGAFVLLPMNPGRRFAQPWAGIPLPFQGNRTALMINLRV